jgi:HK97 family phage portal protein
MTVADMDRLISMGLSAQPTNTGLRVSPDSALASTAVYGCVRILAEDIASLPLNVFRHLTPRGKAAARDHPLYDVLHNVANPEMDAMQLRQTLQGHLGLWGNAYAEIVRDNGGRVRELWPLRPDKMHVFRDSATRRLVYRYTLPPDSGGNENKTKDLDPDLVLHLRGFGADGIMGYSPIRLHREAVGLALATEAFGARFFGNDARPGIVLTHPGHLGDTGQQNLRESFEKRHLGLDASHRVAVLEEGVTIHEVGIPPEDAQFLETRKFQVVEVARMYRMPLHKINEMASATFSNIEHQSLEYVQDTLTPWLVRWEKGIDMRLLTPTERKEYFVEHFVDGRLRGDIKSRYEAYAIGRNWGWLSANDILEREGGNPIPGGDDYLEPLNMVPAGQLPQAVPVTTKGKEANGNA